MIAGTFSCAEVTSGSCFGSQGFWTAGALQNPSDATSSFVWKMTTVNRGTRQQSFDYTKWYPNQPDNNSPSGTEACVNTLDFSNYEWNDKYCYDTVCYICELEE